MLAVCRMQRMEPRTEALRTIQFNMVPFSSGITPNNHAYLFTQTTMMGINKGETLACTDKKFQDTEEYCGQPHQQLPRPQEEKEGRVQTGQQQNKFKRVVGPKA